jgi:hypothetical protein
MTVAFLSRSGDKGDASGDSTTAACVAPACPAPALCRPQGVAAVRGSRFWALVGDSSDEEDEVSPSASPGPSLRPPPVTVGDFVCETLANPSASFMRPGGSKRSAFAPGGKGPRWLSLSLAGERRRQASASPPRCLGGSSAGAARTVDPASEPALPSPSLVRLPLCLSVLPRRRRRIGFLHRRRSQIQIWLRSPVFPVIGRGRWVGHVRPLRGHGPFLLLGWPGWPVTGPEGAYLSGSRNRSERTPPH